MVRYTKVVAGSFLVLFFISSLKPMDVKTLPDKTLWLTQVRDAAERNDTATLTMLLTSAGGVKNVTITELTDLGLWAAERGQVSILAHLASKKHDPFTEKKRTCWCREYVVTKYEEHNAFWHEVLMKAASNCQYEVVSYIASQIIFYTPECTNPIPERGMILKNILDDLMKSSTPEVVSAVLESAFQQACLDCVDLKGGFKGLRLDSVADLFERVINQFIDVRPNLKQEIIKVLFSWASRVDALAHNDTREKIAFRLLKVASRFFID